ncbi:MAG: TRAP transporter large permease subunit [Alphaproteobacteria bacterium]
MDIGTISLILLVAMLVLLAIGMPLGFASAVLALGVLLMKFGPEQLFSTFGTGILDILAKRMYDILKSFVLISVPLFIFMASLLERSGIARDMYNSLNFWLSRTRGGIAIVTSIMAIIMAAMSGIIGGEVVLLGLIALPQMLRLGYNQNLAIGTICASGSLGTMIPPSIVLIIYGLITNTSIKALFTASFLPGFMLASFFLIYIVIRTRLRPHEAPLPEATGDEPSPGQKSILFGILLLMIAGPGAAILLARAGVIHAMGQAYIPEGDEQIALVSTNAMIWLAVVAAAAGALLMFAVGAERRRVAWQEGKGLIAPLLVVGVVLGSIYGGVTGITEAAAMGCVAVLVLTTIRGEMSWGLVREAMMRTFKSTGTIIWVTFGATALAGAYTIAGGPTYVANLIVGADMPTMAIILVMMVIFLVLGALMDWVGIVLLVMPVFLPIVLRLPVEEIGFIGVLPAALVPIWFGVVFCMNMQVSFLSPPFGPAAFYLKSVAPPHISLTDIFRGFLPFIVIQLLALAVLLTWPGLVQVLLD